MRTVPTPTLDIACEVTGPEDGRAVLLLHGFPDDIHAWDAVAPALAGRGWRVVVPYLRGCGPTRFRNPFTPRSGQQAALGRDAIDLMDALGIGSAVLAGYDWGGRGACVAAALWPERVAGLVSATGYAIQHIASAGRPAAPTQELRYWYQWYLHTERGRAGLAAHRREFCRMLWRMWSPDWAFAPETFARTAESFDNPDWVEVVVHSYRHRYGAAAGDPALEGLEARLAQRPAIAAPAVNLHGANDGVHPPTAEDAGAHLFTGRYRREIIPGTGHFLPQEAPGAFVAAIEEAGA